MFQKGYFRKKKDFGVLTKALRFLGVAPDLTGIKKWQECLNWELEVEAHRLTRASRIPRHSPEHSSSSHRCYRGYL